MKVISRRAPSLPDSVKREAGQEITAALESLVTVGSKFIVNDTKWYIDRNGVPKPCVMNSAEFLSKRFQATLRDQYGWRIDETIEGQEIDGYREFEFRGRGYHLVREALLELIVDWWEANPEEDIPLVFAKFYQRYVKRVAHSVEEVPEQYRHHFRESDISTVVKIGVEFETGNIASSFRAFSKLNTLYARGLIDVGVFVTSDRKDTTACRIWPVSNRNGSFQELEQRQYLTNIRFPIWEFAFQPDGYDQSAAYLNSDGTLYYTTDTGQTRAYGGSAYRIFSRKANGGEEEILLPA